MTNLRRASLLLLATSIGGLPLVMGSGSATPNPPGSEEETVVKWKGCGISKKAFLSACAKAYEEETGIEIKVSGGGATKGIAAAGAGEADFGGTCRACLPENGEDGLGLRMSIVAWDALVPIVFPDNPVQDLTVDQVKGILRGEITDWKDVGGDAGPIEVYAREGKISGVGYSVRSMIFGDPNAEFGSHVTLYPSSGPLEQQVAVNPGAIGITGVSSARQRKVKILAVDGVQPDAKGIAAGSYPYFRPLYLAYKPELEAPQRAFPRLGPLPHRSGHRARAGHREPGGRLAPGEGVQELRRHRDHRQLRGPRGRSRAQGSRRGEVIAGVPGPGRAPVHGRPFPNPKPAPDPLTR